jgi:hypothetical protein
MAYISFQPSDNYNTSIYTGTAAEHLITGVGFQPDIVWSKNRTETWDHVVCNSVTGTGKRVDFNLPAAVATDVQSVKSFDSDGYTLGTSDEVNKSATTYGNWNFKMGTTTGIAGSPSITPTSYSFNATAGQSIITYTGNSTAGATLPHGLGVAPKMIIVKKTDASGSWGVYHNGMDATAPEDYYAFLNENAARVDALDYWNDTAPTSTLFYLGDSTVVNDSSNTYLAFCFAEVKGYSKFGTYVGNGNADGTFIYTGFRPAFFMTKSTTTVENWVLMDDKRQGYNVATDNTFPNVTAVEVEKVNSLLSNGIKMGNADGDTNTSGVTFIYAAFAEFPLVSSNNVPTVAR